MSMKIYRAWRVSGVNITELMSALRAAAKVARAKLGERLRRDSANDLAAIFDDASQNGFRAPIEKKWLSGGEIGYILRNRATDEMAKQAKSETRNPRWDFEFNVSVAAISATDFLLIPYVEDANEIAIDAFVEQMRAVLDPHGEMIDFGYWDNTDKPDDVTDEQWEQRRKIYDDVLDGSNSFGDVSFSFDVGGPRWLLMWLQTAELLRYLPTDDERVESFKRRVSYRLFHNSGANKKLSNGEFSISDYISEFHAFRKGDGAEQIKSAVKAFKETIEPITAESLKKLILVESENIEVLNE